MPITGRALAGLNERLAASPDLISNWSRVVLLAAAQIKQKRQLAPDSVLYAGQKDRLIRASLLVSEDALGWPAVMVLLFQVNHCGLGFVDPYNPQEPVFQSE